MEGNVRGEEEEDGLDSGSGEFVRVWIIGEGGSIWRFLNVILGM